MLFKDSYAYIVHVLAPVTAVLQSESISAHKNQHGDIKNCLSNRNRSFPQLIFPLHFFVYKIFPHSAGSFSK